MKKPTLFVLVVCAAFAAYLIAQAGTLEPPGPPAPTMVTLSDINSKLAAVTTATSHWKFSAVSTTTWTGGGGFTRMSQTCANDFPSIRPIRMCTSADIMTTPIDLWPAIPGVAHPDVAWVQPIQNQNSPAQDISGVLASSNTLSCYGWTNGSSPQGIPQGLVITAAGFDMNACGDTARIACCTSY